uniref:Secreted protein n=1 Tax=Panagrellus redivivus TaxID=6233 RepID=A0A7E4VQN8_PANRE
MEKTAGVNHVMQASLCVLFVTFIGVTVSCMQSSIASRWPQAIRGRCKPYPGWNPRNCWQPANRRVVPAGGWLLVVRRRRTTPFLNTNEGAAVSTTTPMLIPVCIVAASIDARMRFHHYLPARRCIAGLPAESTWITFSASHGYPNLYSLYLISTPSRVMSSFFFISPILDSKFLKVCASSKIAKI